MSVYKIVVYAFIFIGKTGKAACFSQSREFLITACQKFMGITLMAYIKDYCVFRAIENTVKRNCKFNYTKITCEMAAVFTNDIYYSVTDFLSELF